jgi:maltoporin
LERFFCPRGLSNDFFTLDMSGYGSGVEDLDLKFGNAVVAFIGAARPDVVTQNGNITCDTLAWR